MATEKIKIKSSISNKGWYNIVDSSGRKISVNQEKNPKSSIVLSTAMPGDEIELNIVEKGDTNYGNDPKSGSNGKSFPKPNPRKDALGFAVQLTCAGKITPEQMYAAADKLLNYLKTE